MLAELTAENVPTVRTMTTRPQTKAASTRFQPARFSSRARARQAHTVMDAAPRSVPRNAANPTSASTSNGREGSFELMDATCTAESIPLTVISRHTMAASAVAQPHRNAVAGLPAPSLRRANSRPCSATPAVDTTIASDAAYMNATSADPVRMEHTTSRMGTSAAEM